MNGIVLAVVVPALLSILYYHLKTGVPPVPSNSEEVIAVVTLLREARLRSNATIYDLGCGWGSLVIGLARAFPEASIVGFEISPIPYLVAKLRARRNRRIVIVRGDYRRQAPLARADAVTAYLGIEAMRKLASLLDSELRVGAPVVTLCFGFRDRVSDKTIRLRFLGGQVALYSWPAHPPLHQRMHDRAATQAVAVRTP